MLKPNELPLTIPKVGSSNFRGLTIYELYYRQETNDQAMRLMGLWLDEYDCTVTYDYWVQFEKLRKKLNRAIYLKRLKLWLLSLVGR